ncbi:MAG: S41 family peptidase [Chitinispirillaceae bacterium]
MSRNVPFLIILICLLYGCSDLLIGPDPAEDKNICFNLLWKDFDRFYSYFPHKNIDWDSIYSVYRPRISESMSDSLFFMTCSEMLQSLRDIHVYLYSERYGFQRYPPNRESFYDEENVHSYLKSSLEITPSRYIGYGETADSVGYIRIVSFQGDGWGREIDPIIKTLTHCKGVIIDVRNNGGGNSQNAERIASRFADSTRLAAYIKWRNGPEHDDHSQLIPYYVRPADWTYSGPVVLLTDRGCFSSTEMFVLYMRHIPSVTVIGDTTGGSSGNPISRQLPNGWYYSISRWVEYTSDMELVEGNGIAPDKVITVTVEDVAARRDPILEKGVEMINEAGQPAAEMFF